MDDSVLNEEFNVIEQGTDDADDTEEFIDEFDEEAWHAELDDALLEGFVDHSIIKNICKCRILPLSHRAEVWKICLNIANRGNALNCWDGKLDLAEQGEIHAACVKTVQDMELENNEQIISNLESIVTFYCKGRAVKYVQEYAWTELLQPMVALPELDQADLYNCFYAILTRYIPKELYPDSPYNLFRLLLLYHDPELCSFLDSKKVTVQSFMRPWLRTLFSSRCKQEVTQALWDVYLQRADPFFMFFLALVILVNAKEQMVSAMTGKDRNDIADALTAFPSALEIVDVEDFCQLAMYFCDKTPQSIRKSYQDLLFGGPVAMAASEENKNTEKELAQALCLQVAVQDVLIPSQIGGIFDDESHGSNEVRFFLVDCRSPDLYNAGHLKTAFHLDATLMLREPKEFSTAIEALFKAQEQAISAGSEAGGEHLCLIGSGTEEEDQYMYMVIAHLLKNHRSYVSTVRGGFRAILNFLSDANINLNDWITGTSKPQALLQLLASQASKPISELDDTTSTSSKIMEPGTMESFMKSFKTTLKTKSQNIKEKVSKFIEAPDEESLDHVNAAYGKPYRGTQPVFSIGDEDEQTSSRHAKKPMKREDSDVDDDQLVQLDEWMEENGVKQSFPCSLVLTNGRHLVSRLAIEGDNMVCLREYKAKRKYRVVSTRPLLHVAKITSKRACPELITFRYKFPPQAGSNEEDTVDIADKYLIPDAGLATRHIKQHIMRVLDAADT